MKKTNPWKRLLSLALCLCMVLSLVPLQSPAAFAADDVKYIDLYRRDFMLELNSDGSYDNDMSAASATFEAGTDNPELTKIYFQGYDDDTTGYWYAGGTTGIMVERDFSGKEIDLDYVERVYMTGGNLGHLDMRKYTGEEGPNLTEVNISGGYIGTLHGIHDHHHDAFTTDINITVKDAALGEICGGCDYIEGNTRCSYILDGDISIDIANSTVTTIYETDFKGDSTHNGDTYIRVLDSTVKNIYVNPNSNGEHSGYINSGKLNNTDCFTNLVYLNGNTWMIKGDINAALKGKDLVIREGESLTVSSNLASDTKIINYGTLTVKNGGKLSYVVNHGDLILEDGANITTVENRGNLTCNGVLRVWTLDNWGTVDFTGTAHTSVIVNNRAGGKFYCHGDHDGMVVNQDNSYFYCDSPNCETKYSGRYYGVVSLEWKLVDVLVTNEKSNPCYTQEYSCTLVPKWGNMLLSPSIDVYEYSGYTQKLVEGTDYTYDCTTGEFKLLRHAVTYYDLSIHASAYFITNIYQTEVTLDQDRFLWDGTAKEPKVTSVTYRDKVLEEGKDYVFVEYQSNVDPGTGYVVLQGLGDYNGTISVPFEIYQKNLEDGYHVTLEEGNFIFLNEEIKPNVESVFTYVNNGDTEQIVALEEGKDYTVSYENNIKSGTGIVKVTGIGQYTGTLTAEFTIGKASIKNVTITGHEAPFTGRKQSLSIQVTYNGMTLTEGVDYTLRYSSSTPPQLQYVGDTTQVTIQGIGDCFQYTDSFQWSIVDADISDFTFVRIDKDGDELVYSGYPQTPNKDWYVVLRNHAGEELYTLGTWTPVINVSDISTFTPDSYTSFTGSMEIPGVITPQNLYYVYAYDNVEGRAYTGQTQTVSLKAYMVSDAGQVYQLVEGQDYTVSGTTEAKEVGTYSLTLTANNNNFTGSKTVTWTIFPVDISKQEITVETAPAFTYNGAPQTPESKIYYTYPDGTKVEVPGTWTSVTNVGDDTTFTADSEHFTGSVTVEDVVQPLDITELLEMEQTGAYHSSKQEPIIHAGSFGDFTYTMNWDRNPIDVGTYTATITGTKNFTGTVVRTYEVTPSVLSVIVRLEYKIYDGTTDVNVKKVTLEGALWDEDVVLDATNLVVTLPSAAAGEYPTAQASGLTLSGESLKNYTCDLSTVTLESEYGGVFEISTRDVVIVAEEQYVTEGEELDPTMWYVDEDFRLPDGFTLSDVVLTANDSGEIIPSGGVITNDAGEDVTENFVLRYYSSSLNLVCSNHICDEYGFCSNCGGYQEAFFNEEDYVYEISNAGQLYWYAQQLNKYNAEIYVKLTEDIVVPENAPNWVPINASYVYFDGNFKTISGLKCIGGEYDTYVGLFGNEMWWYEISNLHIADSYFEGSQYVGAVVAAMSNGGNVTNCYVTNTTVTGGSTMGTLVGHLSTSSIVNCYADAAPLIGYVSGNAIVENSYYPSETETEDGGKTAAQFASGEVAYLLQAGIPEEEIYDDDWNLIDTVIPHVWGQTIGTDTFPAFGGEKVYQVANCKGEPSAYSNTNEPLDHIWENAKCSVCGEVCEHSIVEGSYSANTDGTHTFTCNNCGIVTEAHSFEDGNCICGAVPTYAITISHVENATVTVDKTHAAKGETVTVTVTPEEGYRVNFVNIYTEFDGWNAEKQAENTYTFVMTDKPVTVDPTLSKLYPITVAEGITGGTVTPHVTEAGNWDEVFLLVSADPGYKLESLTASYQNSAGQVQDVFIYNNTFRMPSADVTVNATFVETEETFSVTIPAVTGGTVTTAGNKLTYAEGDTVTVTISPEEGYVIGDVTATCDTGTISASMLNDTTYTFVMPASNVTVNADLYQPAVITGLVLVVDGTEYTGGTVIAGTDSEVILKVVGTNLNRANDSYYIYMGISTSSFMNTFTVDEAGTSATASLLASNYPGNSAYKLEYKNDGGEWIKPGLFIKFVEPVTVDCVGLVLKDYIGLQVAVNKAKLNGGTYDKAYYSYIQRNPDGTEAASGTIEFNMAAGNFVGAEFPVLAWSMADTFEITVFYEVDGVACKGETITTSVKEQAMKRILGDETDETKALCVAMLNYGANVQDYFNHSDAEANYLANSELTEEQKELPTFAELNLTGEVVMPDGDLKPANKGLNAKDKINVQFAVKNKDMSGYEVRYTIDGVEQPVITSDKFMNLTAGSNTLSGPSIAMTPRQMRSEIAIGFYDAETGEKVYGDIICSVEALAKANAGKATEQLTIAMMVYGDAAEARFGK